MLIFTHYGKFIKVVNDENKIPATLIQCEDGSIENVEKVCKEWLDGLGLTDIEYQILIRVH